MTKYVQMDGKLYTSEEFINLLLNDKTGKINGKSYTLVDKEDTTK